MGFTVVRYIDGKPISVKVSIWDAFKGVPNPKPAKPKPCSCCKKIHAKEEGDSTSEKAGGTAKSATDNNESKSGVATGEKKSESTQETDTAETYSEENDKKIIEMKAEHKSWAEILQAIGKTSKSQLTAHWKTINPAKKDHADAEVTKTNNKDDGNKAPSEDNKSKKSKKKEKAESEKKEAEKTTATATTNDLQVYATRYDKQKWMAAASRHFDLTGERITPQAARRLAEGK